jgi:uridine phosphorylase
VLLTNGPLRPIAASLRETAEQLARHASRGIRSVEMQAAALFALGAAHGAHCGIVAHVTNGIDHDSADQFDKGSHQRGLKILTAMCRAGRRCL